jgi:hypothetical protein
MVDPEASPILKYFKSDHLSTNTMPLALRFDTLARHVEETLPRSAEKSVTLRKLLEAKDSAVRAANDMSGG